MPTTQRPANLRSPLAQPSPIAATRPQPEQHRAQIRRPTRSRHQSTPTRRPSLCRRTRANPTSRQRQQPAAAPRPRLGRRNPRPTRPRASRIRRCISRQRRICQQPRPRTNKRQTSRKNRCTNRPQTPSPAGHRPRRSGTRARTGQRLQQNQHGRSPRAAQRHENTRPFS